MNIYKISLSDDSFLVVDENYEMCIFKSIHHTPKRILVKDFLKHFNTARYKNYVFIEQPMVNGIPDKEHPIYLTFIVEPYELKDDLQINKRYKMSQDIKVGDTVMGADGKPETVTELHSGTEEMYEIEINGVVTKVNGGHILHLIDKETDEEMDMPLNIFLQMGEEFQNRYVMVQEDV